MGSIQEIVRQALKSQYLSIDAENQLRQMLYTRQYSLEELSAFMNLQLATITGQVKPESHEALTFSPVSSETSV